MSGERPCARRVEELRPLAEPEVVLFPYAFAARVNAVEWYAFASYSETPDVAALLADDRSTRYEMTGEGEYGKTCALMAARQMSSHESRLRPLMTRFVRMLCAERPRLSADSLCAWLRAEELDLLRAEAAFYKELVANGTRCGLARGFMTFNAHALLGELACLGAKAIVDPRAALNDLQEGLRQKARTSTQAPRPARAVERR